MTLKTEAVGTVGWRGIVYRTAVDLQAYTTLYETVCHCLLGSVSVVFKIYRAMALLKFSSRSSARHSEAQLRLAPNRPCMTLVLLILAAKRRRRVTAIVWRFLSVRPSVRRNPPLLNGKGRHRESTHSRSRYM